MTDRIKQPPSSIWFLTSVIALLIIATYFEISQPEGGLLWDFRTGYYAAGHAVLHGGSSALWPLVEDRWFVNLPIIAWIFAPFGMLEPREAGFIFLFLGLVATAGVFLLFAKTSPPSVRPVILLMMAADGPMWYSELIGNSTHFILLLLVSALALWKRRWMYSAGGVIGIAAVIKPMLLLLGVYFLWRRNWRVVFGGATVIGVAIVSTIVVFGLAFTIGWYQLIIESFAGKPMGAHNVQSLDAFLLRLDVGPELLFNWHPQKMPYALGLVRNACVGSLAALTGWAMWVNRRPPDAALQGTPEGIDNLEFCIVLTLCVTLSTVSWTHYYALLLIPWSLYLAGQLPLRNDKLTHGSVWASIVLCSVPCIYPHLKTGWLADLSARTFQSVWLFGGLMLLLALLRSALARPSQNVRPWLPDMFAPVPESIS